MKSKDSTENVGSASSDGITGRDGYIIAQALAYAVEIINRLPGQWQEHSNMCDMQAILSASGIGDRQLQMMREGAGRHIDGGIAALNGEDQA